MESLFDLGDEYSLPPYRTTPPLDVWGINFGGGTNSFALALTAYEKGLTPNWQIFADTGSETPETYKAVEAWQTWCANHEWPFEVVKWIRKDGSFESVHENCLRTGYLPSKAYGYSGCTSKWKIQPMQKWRKEHGFVPSAVAIGYDAGERRRIDKSVERYCNSVEIDIIVEFPWYPLIGWGMDRSDCIDVNLRHGIVVGKSSCFCCPNMREPEWNELKLVHPDLYQIAEQIEDKAVCGGNAKSKLLFKGGYRDKGGSCMCNLESEIEG